MRQDGRVSPLSVDRYGAELEAQVDGFARSLRGVDLTATVVTCPDWSLAVLAHHIGAGARWMAEVVATRAAAPPSMESIRDTVMPEGDDVRSAWLASGVRLLVDAVRGAPAGADVWTFLGPRPAAFWLRRMTSEAAVHRVDAAITLGLPFELAPDLAADFLSEGLTMIAERPAAAPGTPGTGGGGETLHFHATDEGLGEAGEWFVRRTPEGIELEHGHAKADVAVRGPAALLLLVLLRRLPPTHEGIQVLGDGAVLTKWLEDTKFA